MRFLRSSALTLAVGYIGLGLAALALFAAPLWYAWRVTIQEGRNEVLQSDAQRLTEVFRREGAAGLVSYINRARRPADRRRAPAAAGRCSAEAAGRQSCRLAGRACPPIPAPTRSSIPAAGQHVTEVALVHATLPGGYHLLVGRDIARYAPLEQRFWYALAGAVAILSVLGTTRRHPDPARADGAHPRHPPDRVGDHPGRSESSPAHPSAAAMSSTRSRKPSTACSIRSSSWSTACAMSPTPSRMTCARRWRSCARGWRNCR